MKYQFASNACLVVLMPTLLVLASGCSTHQVISSPTPQTQSVAAVESKAMEPLSDIESSPVIEPKAIAALQKMGGLLRTLKTYKVDFKVSKDEVLDSGQKIMVDGTSELTVQTPDHFHFSTKIDEAHRDLQFFYDGKTFTIYGNTNKLYASVPAAATIHELLDVAKVRYDIDLPFRDLFSWGTDTADVAAIQSAIYIGPTKINDVPCDHYAFRNMDVDWQLWIQQGKTPLPRKLVITTKTEEGQPQYVSDMDWKLSPKINNKIFTFVPQKDAYKIEFAVTKVAAENTK
ncbi:DUF2092 domain-containing protein [Methylobacter sp. S3L5C]|uniref:DUF2092 domain-containing protein n=1 Tax=Methylobacter sp. S3L5C TaxID=2839024 RepID=UPI001FABEE25|nr:DUF2092 domain-containing protein [Methylobacter sp. S3L5C]UOA08644.1 DUF2092 domain-containing protein [Methylobacter sp. S3L5C]